MIADRKKRVDIWTMALRAGISIDNVSRVMNPAIGVLHSVSGRKIRVPDDISIIGFDDIHMAQFTVPPLTSIRMASSDLASAALGALPLRSPKDRATVEARPIMVATRLIVRQTSGYPRPVSSAGLRPPKRSDAVRATAV